MFKSCFCLSFRLILPVLCYVSVSDQASGDSGVGVTAQSNFVTVDKTFTTTTTCSNTTQITTQTSEISKGLTSAISVLSGIEDSDSLSSSRTGSVSATDAGNTTLVTTTTPQSSALSSNPSSGLTLSSGGVNTSTLNSTSLTVPSPPTSSTSLSAQASTTTAYSNPVQNSSFVSSISVSSKSSPNSVAVTTTSPGELSGAGATTSRLNSTILPQSLISHSAQPTAVSSPFVSLVVLSGSTGVYTATQIPSNVSVTSTILTSTTDTSGNEVGLIIFPSASGLGWIFPCSLGSCGTPFPPPPQDPPSDLNPSVSLMITSGSTGTYSPTIVPPNATVVSTLLTSTMDASGSVVGLVIYPSSGGRGWEFPCSLGYCGSPFPPPPPPPLNLSLSATLTNNSVSSTMTTLPPGFSTEMSSNSLWTGNTWVTTEAGGSSTIVPVIVGCHNCGGVHGGIILWNLPEIPYVSFELPGFPKLPKFHLPCIKIFGFKIGDCTPKTDQDTSSDNSNQSQNPDEPSSTASEASSSATSSSQSSPSSSESCTSSQTVSDCSIICPAAATSSGVVPATTSCSTTCYSTLTGCSITGTTTVSTLTTRELCSYGCSSCMMTWTSIAVATCTDCLPGTGIPMATLATTFNGSASPTNVPSLVKRTMPDPWQWSSMDDFLINEYNKAQEVKHTGSQPPGPDAGTTSAVFRALTATPFNLFLPGMWGCTSVVIMSQKGVWMSHIYERPACQTGPRFQSDVINAMTYGTSTVPSLFDSVIKDSITPETGTKVFIITPWDSGTGAPNYAYQSAIDILTLFMNNNFDVYNVNPIGYYPTFAPGPDDQAGDIARDIGNKYGKILFQYDPVESRTLVFMKSSDDSNCCWCYQQQSKTRLWFEDNLLMNTAPFTSWSQQQVEPAPQVGVPYYPACPNPLEQANPEAPVSQGFELSGQPTGEPTAAEPTGTVRLTNSAEPTTSFTSSAQPSETTGTLFCAPTSGPGAVPTGIPQTVIASNITNYCSSILGNILGCDNSTGACTLAISSIPQQFDYPGVTAWLNISLVLGVYPVTEETCNSALGSVLNNCPPLTAPSGQLVMKFGGGIQVSNGLGGMANFNITLISEPCQLRTQEGCSGSVLSSSSTILTSSPISQVATPCPLVDQGGCPGGPPTAPWPSSTTPAGATPAVPTSVVPTVANPGSNPTSTSSVVEPAPAPYQTGTCEIHIWEVSKGDNSDIYSMVNITDGGGNLLTAQTYTSTWGDTITVNASVSPLPYPVSIWYTTDVTLSKRSLLSFSPKFRKEVEPIPPTVDWESWIVRVTAGSTVWDTTDTTSTKLPYCTVGNWDNQNIVQWLNTFFRGAPEEIPNRQMNFYWAC